MILFFLNDVSIKDRKCIVVDTDDCTYEVATFDQLLSYGLYIVGFESGICDVSARYIKCNLKPETIKKIESILLYAASDYQTLYNIVADNGRVYNIDGLTFKCVGASLVIV